MDDGLRLVMTAVGAPLVAYVMWVKIARPVARWIVSRIPPGKVRDILTKNRGGHY